jgi:hypothetical protein
MIFLDPSTCTAFYHVVSSFALHSSPPELGFQVIVHICVARVDGIIGCMGLIKDFLS